MSLALLSTSGLELIGRFYSFYFARVIDNIDPENRNRIKVFIHSVNDGYVCWALPKNEGGGFQYGVKRLAPQIDDLVLISFERGELSSPWWEPCPWVNGEAVPVELRTPNTFGFITPNGNKVYMNDTTGDIWVDVLGNINVSSAKQIIFNRGQNQGIIKIQELTDKINNLVQELETLRNAFNAHTHPGVQTGAGTTSPTVNPVSQPFSQFNKSDYENTKILH